jgi:hypothetical protein
VSLSSSSRASPYYTGGSFRAGAPASSFSGGFSGTTTSRVGSTTHLTPVARRSRGPSPEQLNRSLNESIRSTPGPISQSIFRDAPVERTSPVGAETFNRRYADSVAATGL